MSEFHVLVGSLSVEQFTSVVGFIFGLIVLSLFISWFMYDALKSIFSYVSSVFRKHSKELSE